MRNLVDNLSVRLPSHVDLLLQDELTHASLLKPNGRPRKYPVVSIVHNLRSSERRPRWQNAVYGAIEKRYLESVDGLVFNSDATRDSVRCGLGVDRPFVVAAPGGDRLGSWTATEVHARAFEPGPLRIIFLANLTPLKGLQVLLETLSALPREQFELDIVGSCDVDKGYADAMRRQALQLGARVIFHGALDGEPLIERLRRAQVMAIPSYYEGFGIAYVEGMAFGLPSIGVATGAVPEIIFPGENGFLIPPGDFQSLAKYLSLLGSDRNQLARMAESALRNFKSRPTWEASGEAVRRFLLTLLDSGWSKGRDGRAQ